MLELLGGMAVTSLIAVLLLALMQSATTTWQRNTDRSKAFAAAKAAFESMSGTTATKLSGKSLKYRVFRADTPIRAAKWSPI